VTDSEALAAVSGKLSLASDKVGELRAALGDVASVHAAISSLTEIQAKLSEKATEKAAALAVLSVTARAELSNLADAALKRAKGLQDDLRPGEALEAAFNAASALKEKIANLPLPEVSGAQKELLLESAQRAVVALEGLRIRARDAATRALKTASSAASSAAGNDSFTLEAVGQLLQNLLKQVEGAAEPIKQRAEGLKARFIQLQNSSTPSREQIKEFYNEVVSAYAGRADALLERALVAGAQAAAKTSVPVSVEERAMKVSNKATEKVESLLNTEIAGKVVEGLRGVDNRVAGGQVEQYLSDKLEVSKKAFRAEKIVPEAAAVAQAGS